MQPRDRFPRSRRLRGDGAVRSLASMWVSAGIPCTGVQLRVNSVADQSSVAKGTSPACSHFAHYALFVGD
jgi:hypothetical protein